MIRCEKPREETMPRAMLALIICCTAAHGAAAAGGGELSSCLDPSTALLAGADIGDKELVAAQSACARLKQSSSDRHTIARIDAAAANIADELKRRQASKH
jgi:hypothetical protein